MRERRTSGDRLWDSFPRDDLLSLRERDFDFEREYDRDLRRSPPLLERDLRRSPRPPRSLEREL